MSLLKEEIKYIGFAMGFAIAWFLFIMPMLLRNGIENSNQYLQFFLFNIGLFIILNLFLKAQAIGTNPSMRWAIGLTIAFVAIDIIIPPFSVSTSGQLLGSGAESLILIKSSSDYIIGSFAIEMLNLKGFLVYVFTYIISPFILFLIAAKLIPNFVKQI